MISQHFFNWAGRNAFDPAVALFGAGEQGGWYDPSDLTTMWQDHQGVTPVTATSQSVGLILDKRIGTRTQVFSDANVTFSGPTGYAGRISPGVYEYARDASGIGTVSLGGLTMGRSYLATWTVSSYTGSIPGMTLVRCDPGDAGGAVRPFITTAGTYTAFFTAADTSLSLRSGAIGGGATITNVSILEVAGNHATQANLAQRPLYQIDGTGRPFLLFDGSDDGMATGNIVPGTDKAQVFAGVRKLSDAARGVVAEHTASTAANNGGFVLNVPDGASSTFSFYSKGTLQADAIATGLAAPTTRIVTGLGDIAGDSAIVRVNGAQAASSTTDQGTGNFATAPLFIGRRGGSSMPFNGRLYGLIVRFGANLTADQITQTETWLNQRTGAF
ncbi:MAG: LamG-like jellyroll fold domain-containing protein [Armatimonadia bacterium]